jgi:hypothetical protein
MTNAEQGGAGRSRAVAAAARVGFYACLLGLFAAGWFGMRSQDWRVMLASALAAAVAGVVASALKRIAG